MDPQHNCNDRDGYEEGYEITLDEALDLAKSHHMEGNLLLADRTYRDILNAAPDHFPTTHFLGVLLYQMAIYDEALHYLKKAVEVEPNDKQVWNNLGAVFTDIRDLDNAMQAYSKALTLDPEFGEALNNKALTQWFMNEYDDAEQTVRQSLAINPSSMDARSTLGIVLSSKQKYEEACEIWKALTQEAPNAEKPWINWGNTLRQMGKLSDSEDKCRKALDINPDNPEAHNNLANALRDRGQPEKAIEHYTIATNLKPEYFEAHANKAVAYCDESLFGEALIAARYACAFKKDDFLSNSVLSVALRNLGSYQEARAASLRAIHANPDIADAYLDLAEVNYMADYLSDSHAALEEALKRKPDDPRTYKKIAEVREKMSDYPGAIEAIDKAIDMAPDMPILLIKKAQILHMLDSIDECFAVLDQAKKLSPYLHLVHQVRAEILISVNRNDKALEAAEKALELNPNAPGPYATLISLKKYKSEDDEGIQKLLSMQKDQKRWGLEISSSINYALAQAYEQFKNYDKSFAYLKQANDVKRQFLPYKSTDRNLMYQNFKNRYSLEFIESMKGKGFESDLPVFIVGMPRSGTTLTEQIISSHPDVYPAGELNDIVKLRELLGGLDEDNVYEFGKTYIERIKRKDKTGKALRITDKMPGNFMNIGLILSILPNAKIIHCRRDPVDTCLSCYKQNFAAGQHWSYDLEELADEYNAYLDIMAFWRQQLPGQFLEINYEETVNNFEEQARRLIDYVGLPWNDACLEPHKQKRTVLTASKGQVTQPIYKTSVKKWKQYEEHLKPLIDKLNYNVYEEEKAA